MGTQTYSLNHCYILGPKIEELSELLFQIASCKTLSTTNSDFHCIV
jgi:hypothetical protein